MLLPERSTRVRCTRKCAQLGSRQLSDLWAWRSSLKMPVEQEDDRAIRKVRRKFWIALAFTPAGGRHCDAAAPAGSAMSPQRGARVLRGRELLLSTPVVLGLRWTTTVAAGWESFNRSPNMYTLIGLGVIVAFIYSLVATAAPQIFPGKKMRDRHGMVGVYFEVASAIIAIGAARRMVGAWRPRPHQRRDSAVARPCAARARARVNADGAEEDRTARPRTRGPIACACGRARRSRWMAAWVEGRSSVDESMLTGEPMPGGQGARRSALSEQPSTRPAA
jgi:Cu+-exporting ATPase